MKYNNVFSGEFISRPNRFIAYVKINGKEEICHVKNTGRCRELLIPGVKVLLEKNSNPERKTAYDVIAVYKGDKIINIDSSAPNKVFFEYLKKQKEITFIKPESKYGNSRFDFYVETKDKKIFIETKGVTLEENGVFMFPDAPTERGIKHLRELVKCKNEGYEAVVIFVIQAESAKYFTPNKKTHKEFSDALKEAEGMGVKILCFTCRVEEDFIEIDKTTDYLI